MTDTVLAYIGVGANLGFAEDAVLNALADLSHLPDSEFIAASSLYRSAPIDAEGPDFINAVAAVETALSAGELLATLLAIELRYGRVRTTRNAPRTLDLDLLLYGSATVRQQELVVPHPRLAERAFVLMPLLELDAEIVIPGQGSARALLERLPDQDVARLLR
jgi:2-amino-4-hydroxy-6-hydroxymethyldihydropteridine diphosphokinase